jgi:hypothetical protein
MAKLTVVPAELKSGDNPAAAHRGFPAGTDQNWRDTLPETGLIYRDALEGVLLPYCTGAAVTEPAQPA